MPDSGQKLSQVYWIGGGSGAGKSTVAYNLGQRYGLRVYDTDAVMSKHAKRSTPKDSPFLHRFIAMDMDERWVNRDPQTMLETFHWFRGEGFGFIVDDLLNVDPGSSVVAEGFRLLPHLAKPLLTALDHAVWLLPTPEFRRAAFDSRGWTWRIAKHTSDPETALANLLERDRLFTERLADEVERLGLQGIEVDGSLTEHELVQRVAALFGLRE